ncbi:unnamed protein product [Ixodes hexagonus]
MASGSESGDVCLNCNQELDGDGKDMQCTECRFSYHLGNCSGVTKSSVKEKKQSISLREGWVCQTCRISKTRSKASDPKPTTPDGEHDIHKKLTEIAKMLMVLGPLEKKVDDLASVKETVQEIERKVQRMSDRYDEAMKKLTAQEAEMSEIKQRVKKIEETQPKNEEITKLKQDLNKLEQYGRLNNLEVHGILVTEHENLIEKLGSVADKLEVARLKKEDVEAVHRVPSRKGKTPPIMIRFLNRSIRDEWLKNKNKLRSEDNTVNVYLQENLTETNKKLFFEAREKAKSLQYRYTWHRGGCTYVRKQDGDRAIRIATQTDLDKIK